MRSVSINHPLLVCKCRPSTVSGKRVEYCSRLLSVTYIICDTQYRVIYIEMCDPAFPCIAGLCSRPGHVRVTHCVTVLALGYSVHKHSS